MGAEVSVILDGWWRVFHQSTEYLITGKLNKPTVPITEDIYLLFQNYLQIAKWKYKQGKIKVR